ncbi:DUF859 family phage minor structural protein [Streptococcus dysgalactiae]|uniref:Phage structural protein n=1 Tax=Streptococcus dysgalactiae subsp. dysgalactiae TaxID=99822 RepID=A0A9X7RXU3_STRDY|nr:DUF859 family phage minor structural protein [Streptococcus dysgalactiae]QGH01234.1 hypothetical protein EA457_00955 [Streptococcus dysgalactiae subsp. dysgalactiae]
MAEFWSNSDRGYRIRLWLDQTSQSISGNSSQVRVRLALLNTTTTFAQYSCSAYVDLNGQRLNWSGSPNMTSYNSTIMLIDQTITVGHNADGTKSFGFIASFSGSGGWAPGTLTVGSGTFTLTTIPRSSSVSVTTGTIGSAITININRQSSSFKHTVRYTWGSKSGTIASNVDTSTTWTIPLDFASDIPNSTSGTGTIYVDTYNEGTKTGTQSVSFTASVPASMKPTLYSVTLTDTNGVARGLLSGNNFLQVISNIQVTFDGASGSYSSSITGYKAEIVNKNQVTNSNGGTLGIMNFNGSATVRASVFDSRGRQSDAKDITINVIEYFAPIFSFTALRTRASPNIIQVIRNARISPISLYGNQKNVMTLSFKVAPLGSTYYTSDNGSASGVWTSISNLTNSQANLSGNYIATKSFVVIGTLSDKFTSTEFSATVATESVVMSYDKDGRVGIGKIADLSLPSGSVDSLGGFFVNGKSLLDMFYPVGTIYESVNATNPSTFMGGTWTRFGNGKVLVGVDENDADFNSANKTGGEKSHVLTKAEMPQHDHNVSNDNNALQLVASSTKPYAIAGAGSGSNGWPWQKGVQAEGGDQPHNNLQPYVTIYRWQRTA